MVLRCFQWNAGKHPSRMNLGNSHRSSNENSDEPTKAAYSVVPEVPRLLNNVIEY